MKLHKLRDIQTAPAVAQGDKMPNHRIDQAKTTFRWFYLLAVITLVLTGCASAPSSAPTSPAAEPAFAPGAAADMGAEAPAASEAALPGAPLSAAQPRQIIARANITLVVQETEQAVAAITQLVTELGGYISNANLYKSQYGDNELLQGTLTVRVPAEQTDQTLAQLEALAVNVRGKTLNREDVTDQYTDLQAQLRNLQATENELRELLAEVRAKPDARPEDILTVHQHLMSIRGQIEQVQGRRNMFDNLIALATIEVTLIPDPISQPLLVEGWRASVVLRSALTALVEALRGLATAAIWFVVYLLPLALIVVAGLGGVAWLVRWLVQRLIHRTPPATT